MKVLLSLITIFLSISNIFAQETKIIAHRGAWKNTNTPQNSIAALQEAIKQEVWGTEFDVHMTKDEVLVVNHDYDFYGIDIATSTYEELLAKKHPNGEKIPTAEEYLLVGLKQNKTKLIYELKTNRLGVDKTLKSVALSIDLFKKLNAYKIVEVIAFSFDACEKFRKLDSNLKVHYLNGEKEPSLLKQAKLSGFDYNIDVLKKSPVWVSKAQELNLKTNVWTVNTKEDMLFFIDLKLDYITTDEPELLKNLIKK